MSITALALIVPLCIATLPSSLQRMQDGSIYRTYQIGDDLQSIARKVGVAPPRASLAPQPLGAVLELTWRAPYVRRGAVPPTDPLASLVFSFYEDQLFRIVIDYEHDRTEGMTEADMVAAISRVYGPPLKRERPRGQASVLPAPDVATVIALWADGDSSIALLGVESQDAFRMTVTSARLERLVLAAAGTAIATNPGAMTSVDLARPNAHRVEKTAIARELTRRTNIAAFAP